MDIMDAINLWAVLLMVAAYLRLNGSDNVVVEKFHDASVMLIVWAIPVGLVLLLVFVLIRVLS